MPLGKKRASDQALSAGYVPKSVMPAQHAQELPGKHLLKSAGTFCCACQETLWEKECGPEPREVKEA